MKNHSRYSWLHCLLFAVGLGYVITTALDTEDKSDKFLIPPSGIKPITANITLKDFLLDSEGFYLGMAPSFFGYYGYLGALTAWEDEKILENLLGLAGASSGAMTAILLASGISPSDGAAFCTTVSLEDFADFPGLFTVFRGDKFERIMESFMQSQRPNATLLLQDSEIPVAVSGFDLLTMQGKLLTRGRMARAARASACFPFLFQPVGWIDRHENFLFTDGGITDPYGLNGLGAFGNADGKKKRVINLNVGNFHFEGPIGPSAMPKGVKAREVVSISIRNLPPCGPWAMNNGPLAVDRARLAMKKALDLPMYIGREEGHYEIHIDTSSFVPDNN